jgi:hypothetical protein
MVQFLWILEIPICFLPVTLMNTPLRIGFTLQAAAFLVLACYACWTPDTAVYIPISFAVACAGSLLCAFWRRIKRSLANVSRDIGMNMDNLLRWD